jgi:hypothetical protein
MLIHSCFEGDNCVIADTFQIFQASAQHIDSFNAWVRLNSEVHLVLLGMGDGVAAEVHVGAE